MRSSKCFVDAVDVGKRLRSIDPEKVTALAESINTIGLQQPISVWSPDDDTLDLVAGLHRLEACRQLGWDMIDCIFVNLDDLDRQLWEIDENLMRTELGPAEMAEHLKRRKELWEEREKKVGQVDPPSGQKKGFATDTEDKTGTSKRTTNRAVARAEAIPADVLGKIRGTELDKGTYIDKLKKLTRDEMRAKVDHDLEKIERRKSDASLKAEEDRRKKEVADARRRDFADMGEILERLSSEKCERFLNLLSKYSAKTANDLRPWTSI